MKKAICISIVLRLEPAWLFIFCLDTKNETKKIKAVTTKPKIIPENLNSKNSPFTFIHRLNFMRNFVISYSIFYNVLAHTVLNF